MFKNAYHTIRFHLPNIKATKHLGNQIAALILKEKCGASGLQIHLQGEIGTGKTTLTRFLLKKCGIRRNIKSPSYTILETYEIMNLEIFHLDFYRFRESQELITSEFRDLFHQNSITIVEWPERVAEFLPIPDITIHLEYFEIGRSATLTASSLRGSEWLKTIALAIH